MADEAAFQGFGESLSGVYAASPGAAEAADASVDTGWKPREFRTPRRWIVFIADNIAEIVYPWLTTLQGKKKNNSGSHRELKEGRFSRTMPQLTCQGHWEKDLKVENPNLIFNAMFNLKLWL